MRHFFEVFIPLFAVMNALPLLPLVLTLTDGMEQHDRSVLLTEALAAGAALGAGLAIGGALVLGALGITLDDIRISGGLVLLTFAVHDLLFSQEKRKKQPTIPRRDIGIVPLGVPILMGPAGMTAILVVSETEGRGMALAALALNAIINWFILFRGELVRRLLGRAVLNAVGKVYSLMLAGLAVALIRKGVTSLIRGGP